MFDPDPQTQAPAQPVRPGDWLLAIRLPAATQSKSQRAFNRLIGQIRAQCELLAQWQAYSVRHNQRMATELQPLQAQVHAARRALLLDQLLAGEVAGPALSKAQRQKIKALVPAPARLLLEDGPDADIEPIYDRHSDVSHADLRQAELAEAESVFGEMLGDEVMQGHQAPTGAARSGADQQWRRQTPPSTRISGHQQCRRSFGAASVAAYPRQRIRLLGAGH